MKKAIVTVLAFCFAASSIWAQKFSLSGTVKDVKTGEELIGASIRLKTNPSVGTVTNEYGFYSLTLEKGSYTLIYDYVGYERVEKIVVLDKNQQLNVPIGDAEKQLETVVISSKKQDENIRTSQMGVEKKTF
jgi:hypothetical protein